MAQTPNHKAYVEFSLYLSLKFFIGQPQKEDSMQQTFRPSARTPRTRTLYDLIVAIFVLVRSKFADDHPVAMRHMLAIGRAAWVLVYLLHRPVRDIQVGEIINLWPARLIDLRYPKMPSQQRGEWQYLLKLLIGHARAPPPRSGQLRGKALALAAATCAAVSASSAVRPASGAGIPSKTRSLRSLLSGSSGRAGGYRIAAGKP